MRSLPASRIKLPGTGRLWNGEGVVQVRQSTAQFRQEEASGGFYHSEMWQGNYPKIQIRTINQLLDGHGFELPPRQSAYQAAPRVRRPEGQQATLEEMTGEPHT